MATLVIVKKKSKKENEEVDIEHVTKYQQYRH